MPTAVADVEASNYHRSHHTRAGIELPRAGYDRLLFSAPRATRILRPWPVCMDDYKRSCDQHSKRAAYARRAMYRHLADSAAPVVEIFYEPIQPFRPRFRVVLRASMTRLLDLDQVNAVLGFLRAHTGVELVLCELELTLDFPPRRASELRRLYAPRRRVRDCADTRYWGSRKSAVSLRCYLKTEDSIRVARFELVARRDALRKWHLNSVDDLGTAQWSTIVGPMLQFVMVDPRGQCSPQERAEFENSFLTVGVSATLKALPRARRERLRRQLRPAPISREVMDLLRALETQGKECGGSNANRTPRHAVA